MAEAQRVVGKEVGDNTETALLATEAEVHGEGTWGPGVLYFSKQVSVFC